MADNPIQTFLRDVLPATHERFQHNPVQCAYAASISASLAQGPGVINCVEGDTGIGKTLAYLLTLADWIARGHAVGRQAVIATYSRALQRQLMDRDNITIMNAYLTQQGLPNLTVGLRMGRSNYVAPHRLASALGAPSLEAVLDDSKASKAAKSLAQWGLSGGMLHDIDDGLLPDDIGLADIALHPADPLPDGVRDRFVLTQQCDIQIINHALLALDLVHGNRITTADAPMALLLDEAEHFPGVAESMLSDRLSFRKTAYLLRRHKQVKAADTWDSLFKNWSDPEHAGKAHALRHEDRHIILGALEKLRRAKPTPSASIEARHELVEIKDAALRFITQIKGHGEQLAVSYSAELGYPSLVLLNDMAGAVLKVGASDRVTILTSATLSDCAQVTVSEPPRFEYLRRKLLIPSNSDILGVMAAHQAQEFGDLSFRLPGLDMPPLVSLGGGEFRLNPRFIRAIWNDLNDLNVDGRQLLLCASYTDVAALVDSVPAALKKRLVTHGPGAGLSELANSMPSNGILLTPAGWEGLSPERGSHAFWSHVGIVRNPTPRPDPIQSLVRERYLSRKLGHVRARQAASASLAQEAQVETLHKLRQGIGRAIRHPDDQALITLYDPRFPCDREVTHVRRLNWLPNAIPFRFRLTLARAQQSQVKEAKLEPPLVVL